MDQAEYYKYNLDKLSDREANGERVYPHVFNSTNSIRIFNKLYHNEMKSGETKEEVIEGIAGRVVSIRSASKKLFFINIQSDGDTVQVLGNVMFYGIKENFSEDFKKIQRGDIIGVIGNPHRSLHGELSILPKFIEVLTPCLKSIPSVRNSLTDIEIRFRQRYLDFICNTDSMRVFRIRSLIIQKLRTIMDHNEFIEVETPMLNTIHGGASAKPFETHHNDLNIPLFMRIAPELYLKRLIVGGFERVFEIGKQFRNESIDLTHNPEFTTCEFYWAYKDYLFLMEFTEFIISRIVLEIFNSYEVPYETTSGEKLIISYKPPFRKIDMISELEKCLKETIPTPYESEETREFLDNQCIKHDITCLPPRTNVRLLDKLVGHFLESQCVQPTFIKNHPIIMSPLAKNHRTKPGLTERFELFIAHHEVCNAYTELNDPRIQRERFQEQIKQKNQGDTEAQPFDEDFCQALDIGLPPTAGWGMGIDRLAMFLANKNNIKEVILFPTMRPVNPS